MVPWVYGVLFLSLAVAIVCSTRIIVRQLSASRQARAALTSGGQYHRLAEEYGRLTDMAVTVQEHTDLKLEELAVQLDHLRDRLGPAAPHSPGAPTPRGLLVGRRVLAWVLGRGRCAVPPVKMGVGRDAAGFEVGSIEVRPRRIRDLPGTVN